MRSGLSDGMTYLLIGAAVTGTGMAYSLAGGLGRQPVEIASEISSVADGEWQQEAGDEADIYGTYLIETDRLTGCVYTYEALGGGEIAFLTESLQEGESIIAERSDDGHLFIGWYDDAGLLLSEEPVFSRYSYNGDIQSVFAVFADEYYAENEPGDIAADMVAEKVGSQSGSEASELLALIEEERAKAEAAEEKAQETQEAFIDTDAEEVKQTDGEEASETVQAEAPESDEYVETYEAEIAQETEVNIAPELLEETASTQPADEVNVAAVETELSMDMPSLFEATEPDSKIEITDSPAPVEEPAAKQEKEELFAAIEPYIYGSETEAEVAETESIPTEYLETALELSSSEAGIVTMESTFVSDTEYAVYLTRSIGQVEMPVNSGLNIDIAPFAAMLFMAVSGGILVRRSRRRDGRI